MAKTPREILKRLKRLGLYKGKLKRKGVTKYQKSVAKKFGDVAEGKSTSIKMPARFAREYRKAGARVRNGRVIVAAEKGTRIRANKKGDIIRTSGKRRFIVFPRERPSDGKYYIVTGEARHRLGDLADVETFISSYEEDWNTEIWENLEREV